MSLYTIRALMDASLFCSRPCILVTFFLDTPKADLLIQHDEVVQKMATRQLSEFGIDLTSNESTTECSLPVFIRLIKGLTEEMMKRLDLDCGQAIVTWDDSVKKIFIAFAEKDRTLTSHLLTQTIYYVLTLYSQEESKLSAHPSGHFSNLKHLLDHFEKLGKRRSTKDIQRSLMEENKPWFSLDFNRHNKDLFQIGFGRQQQVLECTVSFESSHMGVATSYSKMQSQKFLAQLGFSVPDQAVVTTAKQACEMAQQFGFPCVLKSDVGTHGKRVYADLRNFEEVKEVFQILNEDLKRNNINSTILVEKFIQGRIYRIEVIKGEFFDAYDMIPAGVIGDGKHTIKELVDIENQKPTRKNKSNSSGKYVNLQLGAAELLMLKKQGISTNNIPDGGQEFRLSANSNWSSGGTFKKVTEFVHKDNQRLAERIAAAFKIDFLGIDLITDDISKSFIDEDLTTIEVNHFPGMSSYYDYDAGRFVDNGKRIIQKIFPDMAYGDVPIIMFKTSELANESETLLSEALNKLGYSAGLINQLGLVVNGQLWAKSEQVDYHNPGLQLLRNNTVGAAIIDQSSENLADFGLGTGGCDIAVLLNCKNEKIITPAWPLGISSTKIDSFLSLSARIASIVHVDNAEALKLCQQCHPEKLFALYLKDVKEPEQLLELDVDRIQLSKQTEEGLLLDITYKKKRYEKWLDLPSNINPLPCLAMLATLLVLNVNIDKAKAILESKFGGQGKLTDTDVSR